MTFGCSGIFPLEFPGLSLFFPEHFGKILPGVEEQMLICIYACFWALMRLGGAFLIKASSEAGPCEADWGGKRKCHTVRRVWAREKGALEPSLSYELREGLVGICGWRIADQKSGRPSVLIPQHRPPCSETLDKSYPSQSLSSLYKMEIDMSSWTP